MKSFDEKHVKNVVLVGSAKSGKTTLAEALLLKSGSVQVAGLTSTSS